MVASLLKFLKCYWRLLLDWASCRHAGQTVAKGKELKSVLTIRLLLNSEQSQTDLRGIKRTSIQRQYYLASFQSIYSSAVEFSIPHGRLCSLKSVASEYNTLVARKGMPTFSKWPIAGYPSKSEHWSTEVIRQSGIQSLNTRREWLAASREQQQGYVAYNKGTGCHKRAYYYRVFQGENDTAIRYWLSLLQDCGTNGTCCSSC